MSTPVPTNLPPPSPLKSIATSTPKIVPPPSITAPPAGATPLLKAKRDEYQNRMTNKGEGVPHSTTFAEHYARDKEFRRLWAKWALADYLVEKKAPLEETNIQMLYMSIQGKLRAVGGKAMTLEKETFNDAAVVIASYLGQTNKEINGGTGFGKTTPKIPTPTLMAPTA